MKTKLTTKHAIYSSLLFFAACLTGNLGHASEPGTFTVRPYIGLSETADTDGLSIGVGSTNGPVNAALSSGFTAGFGVGYQLTPKWEAEVRWEYRSNDSETSLADGDTFTEGNYASSLISLNARYLLIDQSNWRTYLGAGLVWGQEIDLDLERDGVENSFSGDGDIGAQLFLGTDYQLNENWAINAELRYTTLSGIDLSGENSSGEINDLDYQPITLQLGIAYRF